MVVDISYERENSGACAPFREKRPAAESRFSAHRLVRPGAVCESRTGIPPLAGFEVSVPDWCGNAGGTAEHNKSIVSRPGICNRIPWRDFCI